jgi:lysophospholipase L1-like esterase
MGIGMARQNVDRLGSRIGSVIAFGLILSVAVSAEEAPRSVAPPPLSSACDVPDADIARPTPLPNFAAALKGRKAVRILAIGSSSTTGVGASSNGKTYPSQLEAILETALKGVNIDIVNRGVSGETAEITAERLPSEVALDKPDLVLWQLGTNDALARVAPEDFEMKVRSTIRWFKENQIDIVLVGMQYLPRLASDASYSAIREALRRAAMAEGVLYVRRYEAMRFISQTHANLELMSKDNFHLNDLGYQCMAEHVAHAVIVGAFAKNTRPAQN